MGKENLDRFGFKTEEHVFHRYFPRYTISLHHYPDVFHLIEQKPDPENPKTISSNLNIVFAIVRYQEMVQELVDLQAVGRSGNDAEKIEKDVKILRKLIDRLEQLKFSIAHDPDAIKQDIELQEKVLELDNFRTKH